MTKTYCDRCKQCVDSMSIRAVGRLELQSYDLNINYHKLLCPRCSKEIIEMIDNSCDEFHETYTI